MIARILSPSASFAGILYNENKINKGQAEFLSFNNFNIIGTPDKTILENYLEKYCSTNSRVKNKQFHAIISCNGKEYDKYSLENIGKDWMEKMGYGNQPYLIYFHPDTNNNHIHIISARVNDVGERISPDFEKIRAVKNINLIMSEDLGFKAKKDVENLFKYSFSTTNQAKLFLEEIGWKLSESNENLNLIKNGEIQFSIEKSKLENAIISNGIGDVERKKKIGAILKKYSAGLNQQELKKFMNDKFGINLIYHFGKGSSKPYGYTVIDNSSKSIMKGSEVYPLRNFNSDRSAKIATCNDFVDLYTQSSSTSFTELKLSLERVGYNLSINGKIRLNGENQDLFKLDGELIKSLKYVERLNMAKKYSCNTREEMLILSKLLYVKYKDIEKNNSPSTNRNLDYYKELIHSVQMNKLDMGEELEKRGIFLYRENNTTFLIDTNNYTLENINNITISKTESLSNSYLDSTLYQDKVESISSTSSLKELLNLFSSSFSEGEQDNRRKRRSEYSN